MGSNELVITFIWQLVFELVHADSHVAWLKGKSQYN